MPYLRISEVKAAGQAARSRVTKSASQILIEDFARFSETDRYDVFLSHSYQDADTIYGVKKIIESLDLSVYVDWIDDAGLDRGKVTTRTAQVRQLMLEELHRRNFADRIVRTYGSHPQRINGTTE